MTATTTADAPAVDLDPLAEWLAAFADDRERSAAVHKLDRLAGAAFLADMLDTFADEVNPFGVIVGLNRGTGRDDLPKWVAVPMTTARKSGNIGTNALIDARDTITGIMAVDGTDLALFTGSSLPTVPQGSASASSRSATRTVAGHQGQHDAVIAVKLADNDGRIPWRIDLKPHTNGKRGASKKATL
jgi:hypothetical protein